ncbi:MAG: asparagine synthase (glutamine-hydrolyzing) [Chitinophagaceae bacterium]|nr:asparagine synthase (glutamine-hydrolyzing) [Chitinophagaceae bacterium]
MCGIAGFLSYRLNKEDLEKMTSALKHRGPDAEGYFFDPQNRIGLGHRRLSIIDLTEAANQPFYSRCGRYVMIYNGEVYNFRDIAAKYRIQPRTTSDTEIILEAFVQKGIDCVHDFNGMFAIAIWDTQEKKLWLIRDRFGVKPLVYYDNGKELVFASELKALMCLPLPKEISLPALQDYLFLEYIPNAKSIFKNYYKLPNGCYLTADASDPDKLNIQIHRYYHFREKIAPRPLPERNENETLDELESLLSSSIRYRQISDVPIGAFLSGGTDSSLICALFQKQNHLPVNTFTIGFDVAKFNESHYAEEVAGVLKTNHKTKFLSAKSSIDLVERITEFCDEPFAVPSIIPTFLVSHESRKHVTVALSGDGGDELFMGYGYYGLYRQIKNIFRLDPGIGRRLIKNIFSLLGNRYQRASRLFELPSHGLMAHLWSEQQYMFSEKEIKKLLNIKCTELSILHTWEEIDRLSLHDFEKISLFDIEQYLAHNLLFKMDSASMANSLEVRNPYLDYRLVEFCFNLPLHYKIRNGTAKYLMKKLLERYLPHHLIYRRKWGFPAPIGDWLMRELSYLVDKWLNMERIKKQGIFNEKTISALIPQFRSGKKYHDKRIWSLIFFQMWHEKYVK